jgi:serine O-acetyltransferase
MASLDDMQSREESSTGEIGGHHGGESFAVVRRDLERYFRLDSSQANPGLLEKLRVLIDSPGLQAVLTYRFGSWINRTMRRRLLRYPLKLLYYVMEKNCVILWGIHIDVGARIGPGFYIGHFGGIIIGAAEIGRDCNVGHQVTIGQRADGRSGLPVIGDRVWIGMGSAIYGNVRICDGVTIGPLTIVSRSLPARVVVSGNPLRVVRKDYDNTGEIDGLRSPPDASKPQPTIQPDAADGSGAASTPLDR